MQVQFIAILLAAVAIGSSAANPSLVSGPSKMFEIMSATSEMQRNNPALATACFTYYQGVFDEDYKSYQVEYDGCTSKFDSGKLDSMERYESYVWTLSNSTYDSCRFLLECDQANNSLDSLNCYSAQGTNHSKVASDISHDAAVYIGALMQEISLYEFARNACITDCTHNYEVRSDKSYVEFQSCLDGKTAVPEPTVAPVDPNSFKANSVPQLASEEKSSQKQGYARKLESLFKHHP
ncbi:uncharacterized protein LOC110180064 [Drosophila serrata]|uniref:uncharacterized protein LOC110180064 n=1 Tax=Drosophila serrata TaxID=7274 RepID=UPI000A1D3070|nr:uncharacterized protein LOC110180064 [Drosophila serrata]